MSNQVTVLSELPKLEGSFNLQNAYGLKFESECLFARQQITKSDFCKNVAQNNQASLKAAILNIAAIGISLNPALAHAYLVPRDGAICLDVSYRGLVKLATDSGAIEWAKAVLVYDGDTFTWRGPAAEPVHEANVFDKERINAEEPLDNLQGGYCIAKLAGGGFLVEVMTADEILEVRNSSKAYISGKPCPWKGKWSGEMAKKTLVKRAYKSWPQSGGRERLDNAVHVLNEHEGLRDEPIVAKPSDYLQPTREQTEKYLELADGDPVAFWLWYSAQDERLKVSLPGCEFEPRKKGETMERFKSLLEAGRLKVEAWAIELRAMCESGDESGVMEFLEEMTEEEAAALLDTLTPEQSAFAQRAAA